MDFLTGWQITPDTLIMIYVSWQLTKMLYQHDKRISKLEDNQKG